MRIVSTVGTILCGMMICDSLPLMAGITGDTMDTDRLLTMRLRMVGMVIIATTAGTITMGDLSTMGAGHTVVTTLRTITLEGQLS